MNLEPVMRPELALEKYAEAYQHYLAARQAVERARKAFQASRLYQDHREAQDHLKEVTATLAQASQNLLSSVDAVSEEASA